MNIIVCCKVGPDPRDIQVASDQSISLERTEWIIGDYDLVAIEAAFRVAQKNQKKVIALSVGPKKLNSSKICKDILCRGPEELILIADDSLENADASRTAEVLAGAVRKNGEFELIVCGEGSHDLYSQQVGLQLGEKLDIPTINGICEIIEMNQDSLVVKRELESEFETLEVPLPAVISITANFCPARLPKMQDILKSSKKPVTEYMLEEVGFGSEKSKIISLKAPKSPDRKQIVFEINSDDDIVKAVEQLNKECSF